MKLHLLLKYTNLVLLLGATAWLTHERSWEPLIVFLTLLSGFVVQEFKDMKSVFHGSSSTDHDRELFVQYDQILNESHFKDTLNNDVGCGVVNTNFTSSMVKYIQASESVSKSFIDPAIDKKFLVFIGNLSALNQFLGTNFFHPKGDTWNDRYEDWADKFDELLLHPDLKTDDDPTKRNLYQNKLSKVVDLIQLNLDSYDEFRLTVKKSLHI